MSQDFRSRYSEMRANDPTSPIDQASAANATEIDRYAGYSNTRNIAFIWPDGRRLFLNYSYLVSGEYSPDTSTILLVFTTHQVMLTGIRLIELFDDLMGQLPRMIVCVDARYNILSNTGPVVNEIKVASTA